MGGRPWDLPAPVPVLPLPDLDEADLERQRLGRLRATMVDRGLDLIVVTNPVNIRYACGYRNYALYQSHIPTAYLIAAAEGPVVLHGGYSGGHDTITDTGPAHATAVFDAGLEPVWAAAGLSADIRAVMVDAGLPTHATVGVERLPPSVIDRLRDDGLHLVDAEPTLELARSRKLAIEMTAMAHSIAVAEAGMAAMADRLGPGMSENMLWSVLHQINIANNGDWMDGRILCSGPRTNPWYQEAGSRTIGAGELMAFDTDMIGPYGYCADLSRTWICGPRAGERGRPTPTQRDLFKRAAEEIEHNSALLHPGASFRELSYRTFRHPTDIAVNHYACAFHGVGMCDEYPKIPYPDDWELTGYDGELEAGTVLSVESYVGRTGGAEGVKLEQMVRVNEGGVEVLASYPLLPEGCT